MKLLSIAVPCYNSQDYMAKCIDSLLVSDAIEVIIVDDGSTDQTALIADGYQSRYPDNVRAIHQKNGGHGCAVMTGLKNATGRYFRVVDSDDWLEKDALIKVLQTLQRFSDEACQVDLLLTNYVYDKTGVRRKKAIHYANAIQPNTILHWNQIGHFRLGQYLLMHTMTYRTETLRQSGLNLPSHTFYVDNLYAYIPLKCVDTLYYLNVNLYHYCIGRVDQSVHEEVMIRRIDQQLLVNRLMLSEVDLAQIVPAGRRNYMFAYLEIITTVSSVLLSKAGTQTALEKKRQLWEDIRAQHPEVYQKLRHRIFGQLLTHDGIIFRELTLCGYTLSRLIFGFN
jgi:glycosyltransferase involved in cell wall biosynthesis